MGEQGSDTYSQSQRTWRFVFTIRSAGRTTTWHSLQLRSSTVIERSRKGTGFDYWLGSEEEAGELPFQNKVRLEVSGIRKADDSRVRARVKQKIEQTNPSDGTFPAYIIIVEFSRPLSFIVEK
ncbi:hypothetical protein [Nostoc sp.]|uniref:hypothetical protein n=1 Tax=Nostoc sp. TaxID=1180 RepID=UPI002FF9436C